MSNPQNYRLMRAVCGLDVHKDTIYLCILCETGEIIERVFGVLTFQLRQMRRLMRSCGVSEVTMESSALPIFPKLAQFVPCKWPSFLLIT